VRLGADLTAAHTVVRLGGQVQFAGYDKWIKVRGDRMPLPNYKVDNLDLQVADFTGTKVLYEGLECLGKMAVSICGSGEGSGGWNLTGLWGLEPYDLTAST
jgi:hypothetical protein